MPNTTLGVWKALKRHELILEQTNSLCSPRWGSMLWMKIWFSFGNWTTGLLFFQTNSCNRKCALEKSEPLFRLCSVHLQRVEQELVLPVSSLVATSTPFITLKVLTGVWQAGLGPCPGCWVGVDFVAVDQDEELSASWPPWVSDAESTARCQGQIPCFFLLLQPLFLSRLCSEAG